MADFTVPNYSDLIDNLNPQIAAGPPKVDFSGLERIPKSYWAGLDQQYQQRNRDLFQNGVPNNPQELVSSIAKAQGSAAGPALMQYYKMLFGQQADQQVNPGGPAPAQYGAAPSQAPQFPPSASNAMPRVGNVPAGSPVPSSSRVMGDAEGVNSGLYDAPAAPGMRPPMQADSVAEFGRPQTMAQDMARPTMQPNAAAELSPAQRVAQGFPSSGALVAPDASDPTLGGLVPAGRTPAQQRALLSRAVSSGMLEEGQSKVYQSQIDAIDKALGQYREGNVKNSELTPDQKNANASGLPSPRALTGATEADKQDNDAFQKRYTGIQTLGEQSYNGIQKAQLMKNLTLDPNFYSGPLNKEVQTYHQFKAIFGSNPSSALPTEAFNKVANDMLTEQVKAMGQSGVGRVLQSEVNIMKQAIASLGITPQSNRALAEIVSRVYQQNQDIADLARGIKAPPGQKNQALDTAISGYLKAHPLFNPQEIQHPNTLGAPDAPPQSMQWSPQQKRQWAQGIGLKPGDPIRFNGQVVSVP